MSTTGVAVNVATKPEAVGEPVSPAPDPARLTAMLDALAAVSETADGVTRLAYTETERSAHMMVAGWFRELGLRTWTDAAGNTIAELPGTASNKAIGTGSHLDTVPHGGRFDGMAGVVAAVEVARSMVERQITPRHPFRFVAFAAEEGARFGQACLGSKAVAGAHDEQVLWALRDENGMSVASAMQHVGLDPSRITEARWARDEWEAFVELHVEQGGVLETSGQSAGLVDLVSGSTRILLEISGRPTHSGSTPMSLRADALCASAEVVLAAEQIASDHRHRGTRATVGVLEVMPGSITTIPGKVSFTVDVRDIDSDRQRATVDEILGRVTEICDRRRVALEYRILGDSSPVVLPMWLRQILAATCADQGVDYRVMTSGASHDCQMVNRTVPAALMFVPSRAGLSHVPEEWTSANDLVRGVDLLLNALLVIDRRLGGANRPESPGGRGK